MAIIAFNFTSMNVERKQAVKGKLSINNNVTITDVSEANLALGTGKQNSLKFTFEFVSKYEPKIGEIKLKGELVDVQDEKKVDEVMKQWKKEKKIPSETAKPVLQTILTKCNIQALILSKDINLPPPIKLPMIKK
ncbi:hypothetical protein KY339_02355 [Candidatus Woesearchaeota archaeon]|jgi:hypothetical protein|nr:hypothetical protein [Candidatus Woesearchaeota archaeon]